MCEPTSVSLCAAVGIAMLFATVAEGQPREVRTAINTVDENVPRGERPYEMIWSNRHEAHAPTEPFEDLAGWTVELYGSAEAKLERSHEQVMWGETSAKLTYRGGLGEDRIVLRPPQPIRIEGHFTASNIWCYGNNWGWVSRPDTPQVFLALLLRDAKGQEHRVGLTNVRWEEWWLVHRRAINQLGPDPAFPFALAGIEVTGGSQPEDRVIFLDSLSFYEEQWPALTFEPRPARNLQLFPGQTQGLNGTGSGRLPFPTREETILPSNYARPFSTKATRAGEKAFEFTYDGPDCTVVYRVEPTDEGLADVTALINGQRVAKPLDGGGVRTDLSGEVHGRLVDVELADGVLTLRQRVSSGDTDVAIEQRYRLWQKSLVVDLICPGGHATEVSLGEFAGVQESELLPIPYANYGGRSSVLLGRGPGKPWFGSVWADWYRSNASEMYNSQEVRGDRVRLNGGVRYIAKTDGQRNDLFERIFLTISPVYEETLPTIANPPSRWGEVAGQRLWQESWGPADFEKEHERSKKLRAYGIKELIQCNHEIAWRDNADSFTLRLRAAPKKGGDEALKRYVQEQKSLGWLSGLYTNYTDFAPVNENWDPDKAQLTPDREWRAAWPRCYALKPSRAVEFDAYYAAKIEEKYGSDSAYTDVHTAVAPWGYCDYDARVPGGGTFAATFYAYGELLLNDSRVYRGPIFSEGTYQSLYAGLPDGNYALQYGGLDLATYPLMPQFDLHKMHPLSTDIGMGWTTNFCTWPNWNKPENLSASIDRFIMATMAYGHIGWLVEETYGMNLACRSYYMLQQLTKRYALTDPLTIRCWNGSGWETTSEAVVSGAYRRSQLRITYPALELYVNGNWDEDWRIEPGGELLPPAGWLARGENGRFLDVSAVRSGRRFDYVRSPEYLYMDGRGDLTFLQNVASRGGVAVRAIDPETLEIIDIGGNREIGFGGPGDPTHLKPNDVLRTVLNSSERRPEAAVAYDIEGHEIGPAEVRWAQGRSYVMTVEKGLKYVVKLGARVPKAGLDIELPDGGPEVAAGEKVRILVRGVADEAATPRATLEGKPVELEVESRRGRDVTCQLTVPADAKPGHGLWVRIEAAESESASAGAQGDAGWLLLAVRDPMRMTFAPDTVVLRGGEGRARIRGALGIGSRPAQAMLEAPDWLSITPGKIRGLDVDQELTFRATAPKAGTLRIVTRFAGTETQRDFSLVPGTAQPVVANLYDGSIPFAWGYAFRGGKEQPGDPATGATFHLEKGIACGGQHHDGIFAHPPYVGGVGYSYALFEPVKLPAEPAVLHLYIGIKDGGDPSDGVDFIVKAIKRDGSEVEVMRANTAERKWTEVRADLSDLAGQEIRLKFIADVGPHDNSTADWASWGEPTIRLKSPVPTITMKPASP